MVKLYLGLSVMFRTTVSSVSNNFRWTTSSIRSTYVHAVTALQLMLRACADCEGSTKDTA